MNDQYDQDYRAWTNADTDDTDAATVSTLGRREPVAYPTLNPPNGIEPADTRGWFPWDPTGIALPPQSWTPEQRRIYEARVQWFHEAKYGHLFHFLAFGDRSRDTHKGFMSTEDDWTSERWNQAVEAVDVEHAADQAEELGAGYVAISLGQQHRYACAPNPVIDALWGLTPGQYNARRDLPMELGEALARRGIPLMCYIIASMNYKLPRPEGWTDADCHDNWLQVVQWYSDHYGTLCKGWWVDGLGGPDLDGEEDWKKTYPAQFVSALKHGNPDALVTSGIYELSDILHGHCIGGQWERQRTMVKPFFGRWDPDFNIQWHVLQYVGGYWGATNTPWKTADLVAYATDVVKGGGVFTFDVGSHKIVDGKTVPCLEIPPEQMAQLRAVRDALKNIAPSDGSR